ncbi:MAG: hypothetical protein Ct9H90mP9_0990 [Pseudomonadota bacterium]|nr:MAG: hypothetical protein Ct9H90mP9_0990 [Pseudomonadota bacterium]
MRWTTFTCPRDERAGSKISGKDQSPSGKEKFFQTRLPVLGQHPDGFHTWPHDAQELKKRTGVTLDQLELKDLFDEAKQVPEKRLRNSGRN